MFWEMFFFIFTCLQNVHLTCASVIKNVFTKMLNIIISWAKIPL